MASSESASDVDYARLREWFDRCVDLPESERLDWIERHVADPDLRLARRWERDGVLRTIALMWLLRAMYFFGASPRALRSVYYARRA